MSLDKVRPYRLERLLRVGAALAAGKSCRQIARDMQLRPVAIWDDRNLFNAYGAAAIRQRLAELGTQPAPATGQPRTCVYLVIRERKVESCGRKCQGQYCVEHQVKTAPVGGNACGAGGTNFGGKVGRRR